MNVRLYVPDQPGLHAGLILVPGNAVDIADAQLNRAAEALARLGVATLIAQLPGLRAGHIVADDVERLVEIFKWLAVHPSIDPDRVGFSGFCIGSSLALIAAADPQIAQKVALVNVFGGYYDLKQLLRAIATQSVRHGGDEVAWEPAQPSVELFARNVLLYVDDPLDRQLISDHFASGAPLIPPPPNLSPRGSLAYQILTTSDPEHIDRLLAQLPTDISDRLDALSPSHVINRVKAPIFVMHDVSDPYVPVQESLSLADAVDPDRLYYSQFAFFNHVRPDRFRPAWQGVWDGLRLAYHIAQIFDQLQV